MDLWIALVSLVIGVVGGYIGGVLQTLSEHRNERRDAALAEIYKEMARFHRYLGSWTANYTLDPNEPTGESSGVPARKHVRDQYRKFVYTFHDVYAIWLGEDTYNLILKFSTASGDFLNELDHMTVSAGRWTLPDGTNPNDARKERITKQYDKVRLELRAEISRYLVPSRFFTRRKNGK